VGSGRWNSLRENIYKIWQFKAPCQWSSQRCPALFLQFVW
jgi:hypothetical protein